MPNNPQRVSYVLAASQLTSTPTLSMYVDNVEHVWFQVRGASNTSPVTFEGSLDGPTNAPSPPTFFGILVTDNSNATVTTTAYHDGLYSFDVNGLHEIRANLGHKRDTVPVTITASGM